MSSTPSILIGGLTTSVVEATMNALPVITEPEPIRFIGRLQWRREARYWRRFGFHPWLRTIRSGRAVHRARRRLGLSV